MSSDAVQRRILALLKDLEEKRAGLAADAAELAAVVPILSAQAEQIGAATEWVNDIKEAISEILASTGKQIEGLKSGNKDLGEALAQLKILQEGLSKVEKALGATAKGLDKRSSELGRSSRNSRSITRPGPPRRRPAAARLRRCRSGSTRATTW